jgi:hypothetical protein
MLVTNTLAYWVHSLVTKKKKCFVCDTSRRYIFIYVANSLFLTSECVQKARVLY